ncbi:hypothetical protein [Microtetraspora malaysiensis]|uniref:hypothetical protein n=1 Tax=Microtetraspora malaysiensis TaxID=161358 RepID=UPI00083342D9|nr:hypothetical protein [Microtetraspora malaysiensis]
MPGQRRRSTADPFEPFAECCRLRLDAEVGDPRLWATTLFDELIELGNGAAIPRHGAEPSATVSISQMAREKNWCARDQ